MKNNKISVIMCIYNTEKYLEKSIKSVLNQTYKNIELIIIEDFSTDSSRELLKKYENNEKVKIYYNEKNRGLAYSRNIGLSKTTGDYIGYIDSDDYIDNDYYEILMDSIIINKSEISVCDINIVYESTHEEILSPCYSNNKFNLVNLVNNGLAASACNKLFLKKIIEKYPFAEGKVNEDIAVIIPALCNAKKISYAENCKYYYVQREKSIQNSSFSEKRFDIFCGVDDTLNRIKTHPKYEILKDSIIYNQIICILLYVVPKEKNLKYRKQILKKFNELSLKYKIRQNRFFWNFLEQNNFLNKYYYKLMLKLNCNKLYFSTNMLIWSRDMYKSIRAKNVIKEDIDINDLVKLSARQNKMKQSNIKISVVVPNYNYAKFMYQRLYSILNQNYKIYEIIILDDKSKDNSIEIINNIVDRIKNNIKIKTIYNENNSGTAFKQWKKGFDNATGDYVWIAEADDYCEANFLKSVVKPLSKNKKIMISYCDTAFINSEGEIILRSIKPEIDILKTKHWNKSYINNGINEIENYSYHNCTIANVSSAIMKNGDYTKLIEKSCNYKQAGDWLFYIKLMSRGFISYYDKPLNYYRVHGNNVSSTMNYKKHIEEILSIYKYCNKEYKITKRNKENQSKRILFLKKVWKVK